MMEDSGDTGWSDLKRKVQCGGNKGAKPYPPDEHFVASDFRTNVQSPRRNCKYTRPNPDHNLARANRPNQDHNLARANRPIPDQNQVRANKTNLDHNMARANRPNPDHNLASANRPNPDHNKASANLMASVLSCFKPKLPQLDIMNGQFLRHDEDQDEDDVSSCDSSSSDVSGIDWFTCRCSFDPSQTEGDKTTPRRSASTEIIYQKVQSPLHSDTFLIVLDEAEAATQHLQDNARPRPKSRESVLTDLSSLYSVTSNESHASDYSTLPSSKNKTNTHVNPYKYPTVNATLSPAYAAQQAFQRSRHDCLEVYRTQPITHGHHDSFSLGPDIQSEYQTNRLICEQIQTEVKSIIKRHAFDADGTLELCRSETDDTDESIMEKCSSMSSDDAHSNTVQIEIGNFSSNSEATHDSSEKLCDNCRCESSVCYSTHAYNTVFSRGKGRRMHSDVCAKQVYFTGVSRRQCGIFEMEEVPSLEEGTEEPPCESDSSVLKESSESYDPVRTQDGMRERSGQYNALEYSKTHEDPSTLPESSSVFSTTSTGEDDLCSPSSTGISSQPIQRAILLPQPSRKVQSCVILRPPVSFKRRPNTVMCRTQRARNIFCSSRRWQQDVTEWRKEATCWRQDVKTCFQTQLTLRVSSAVARKRDLEVREEGDTALIEKLKEKIMNNSENCNNQNSNNLGKSKNEARAKSEDRTGANIMNYEALISCQNKTTLYFSNENANNFLKCTQSFQNNTDMVSEDNSDTIDKVSKILAVESFIKSAANDVNNDPSIDGEHSRKDRVHEHIAKCNLTGKLHAAISKIEIATREKQHQIKDRLEKLFEGARHLKSLEKLCDIHETNIKEQKRLIDDTIQKGKITVLQNVINLGKLASYSETEAMSAGPSKAAHRETVIEHLKNVETASDHRVRRKMKTTMISNGVQNICKAKNKIKNKIRIFRNLRVKELSPCVSSSGEDIAVVGKLRAMIVTQDFEIITCLQLRESYLSPIQVRSLLSRIKLKKDIDLKVKRRINIKKIRVKQISMKNVQLLNSNKLKNALTSFHLEDLLCRLCTVNQTLRRAMGENEKSMMNVSLGESIINTQTLQPFMLISVKKHFIKLTVDKCRLNLKRRTQIHICVKHIIKCDNIRLQVRPIEVINIDTGAIVLRSISFIGRDNTVENTFGHFRHDVGDLRAKGEHINNNKQVSNENLTETLGKKMSGQRVDFVLEYETPMNEEETVNHKKLENLNFKTTYKLEKAQSSSEMSRNKDANQNFKKQEINNIAVDYEKNEYYFMKHDENIDVDIFMTNLLQMTIPRDLEEAVRSSEVMLMETNLTGSSTHFIMRSELPQSRYCSRSDIQFNLVQFETMSNEMDTDMAKSSSTLTIGESNCKTMETNLTGSSTHFMETNVIESSINRQLSLPKIEIKFSFEDIKPGDLGHCLEVRTGRSEDIKNAMLLKESSSVTLSKRGSIIMETGKSSVVTPECSTHEIEKEELEKNTNELNEEISSSFEHDLVRDEEKQYESNRDSSGNIFQINESELQNKLKGVDPLLFITKNINTQFKIQDQNIIEEGNTIKFEIILKADDKSKLDDVLHTLLSTNTEVEYETRPSESLERRVECTVSEIPSSGTDNSSDSSNVMNLDEELDTTNLFDNEGQRILECYEHTLETLSERTERSSSTTTGLCQLASKLSNFRKALSNNLLTYSQCLENKFNFFDELQELSNQFLQECNDKIDKNFFRFTMDKISLKVNGIISLYTGAHCYVTKPYFATRKQRKASKRKQSNLTHEIKEETPQHVANDVIHKTNRENIITAKENSNDTQSSACKMYSKILDQEIKLSDNISVAIDTIDVNKSLTKPVEESTNMKNSEITEQMEDALESSKFLHPRVSENLRPLSQSKNVAFSMTDQASIQSVTETWEVSTREEIRLPRSMTFVNTPYGNSLEIQNVSKTDEISPKTNNIFTQNSTQSTQTLAPSETLPSTEDLPLNGSKIEHQVEKSEAKINKQPIRPKNFYSRRRKLRKAPGVSKQPVSKLSLSMTESLEIQSSLSQETTSDQAKPTSAQQIEEIWSNSQRDTRTIKQNSRALKPWRSRLKKDELKNSNTQISQKNSSGGGENALPFDNFKDSIVEIIARPNNGEHDSTSVPEFEEKVTPIIGNKLPQNNPHDHLIIDDLKSLMNATNKSSTYIIEIPPVEMVSLTDLHTVYDDTIAHTLKLKENDKQTPSITNSYQSLIDEIPLFGNILLHSTGIDVEHKTKSKIPKYEIDPLDILEADRKILIDNKHNIHDITNFKTERSIGNPSPKSNKHSSDSSFLRNNKPCNSNISLCSDGNKTISNHCQHFSNSDSKFIPRPGRSTSLTRVSFKLPTTKIKRRNSIKKRFRLKNPTKTKSYPITRAPSRLFSRTSQVSSQKSAPRKSLTLRRRREKSETKPVASQRSLTPRMRIPSKTKYWESEREREFARRKCDILNKIRRSKGKRIQS